MEWNYAPDVVRNAFFDALNELDEYRIIFSYNGQVPSGVKDHVKVVRWAPQLDILAHPKTLVFLTHGGLKRWVSRRS